MTSHRSASPTRGHGITDEQLKCIFRFGFTTKTNGNGFGLHSAAIAMNEMGGAIRVASGGAGQGATFTITLAAQVRQPNPRTAPLPPDATFRLTPELRSNREVA